MDLSRQRRAEIRERLEPMLKAYDPGLEFITVYPDSSRANLAVVAQKEDFPVVLRLDFLRYVSMPDSELRAALTEQLQRRQLPVSAAEDEE